MQYFTVFVIIIILIYPIEKEYGFALVLSWQILYKHFRRIETEIESLIRN